MSSKRIVILLLLAVGGTALYHAGQRVAPYNQPLASGDTVQYTKIKRVQQGFGAVGSMIVGSFVHSLVEASVQDLAGMKKSLAAKQGMDGLHARKNAELVKKLDSAALDELVHAHPIDALNHAMSARNYVSVVKHTLSDP